MCGDWHDICQESQKAHTSCFIKAAFYSATGADFFLMRGPQGRVQTREEEAITQCNM